MAYYNGYPATYQPMYYQQQNTPTNSLIWVQGEAGAKSYMVAPNNTVALFDSESQTIYLKSADAAGMPSFKVLDYTIREAKNGANTAPVIADDKLSTYATKDEIRAVSEQITALRDRVDNLTKRRRREDEDE